MARCPRRSRESGEEVSDPKDIERARVVAGKIVDFLAIGDEEFGCEHLPNEDFLCWRCQHEIFVRKTLRAIKETRATEFGCEHLPNEDFLCWRCQHEIFVRKTLRAIKETRATIHQEGNSEGCAEAETENDRLRAEIERLKGERDRAIADQPERYNAGHRDGRDSCDDEHDRLREALARLAGAVAALHAAADAGDVQAEREASDQLRCMVTDAGWRGDGS